MRRILVVMAKRPRSGEVKTRLHDVLGPQGAASLYRAMLHDVLAADLPEGVEPVLAFAPAHDREWWEDFAPARDWRLEPQEGAELGARMRTVFDRLLGEADAVVMRNSDSPDLEGVRVAEAFRALDAGADVVFGPDEGGGYYLVGLRRPHPELFEVLMSTRHNLKTTRERAREAGLEVALLSTAPDVDDAADLEALRRRLHADPGRAPETAAWLRRRGEDQAGFRPAK